MGNMTENFVACKEQLLKNTHHLDLTWQLQPPQKYPKRMSTDWLYILAQPHVFLALHRIYLMLSVRQSLKHIIYPLDRYCFFKALTYTSPEYVKCVILCQDPYPSEQAMGLCLSAEKIMPSLQRFFKVIYASYGFDYKQSLKPPTGDLEYLAQQGVLLLNSALTVEEESTEKMDHVRAWSPIIDAILTAIYQVNPYCAFLAMGDPAKEALSTIESTLEGKSETKRCQYESHPMSWIKLTSIRRALGTFNKVREYLNQEPIDNQGKLYDDDEYDESGYLRQYQANVDCINWMPFLPSSIDHTRNYNLLSPGLVPLEGPTINSTDEDDGSGN